MEEVLQEVKEKKNIFYGFVNYRKELKNSKAIIDAVGATKDNHVILVKNPVIISKKDKDKYNFEKADKGLPACYNKIFDEAKKNGADYCFIIADDIIVNDTAIFQKYVDLAEKYKQEILMFPYNRNLNVALNKFPNPISRIKVSENETIDLVRYPDSDFMCVKMTDSLIRFDERLSALYLDYFINDNIKMGKIHSFGFFFDIKDSHQYISRSDDPAIKQLFTDIEVQQDSQIREGEELSLSEDLNAVVAYVDDVLLGVV
jgi:hypothetical protein